MLNSTDLKIINLVAKGDSTHIAAKQVLEKYNYNEFSMYLRDNQEFRDILKLLSVKKKYEKTILVKIDYNLEQYIFIKYRQLHKYMSFIK